MKLNVSGFIEELDLGKGINLGVSATYTFGEKVEDTTYEYEKAI